MDILINEVQEIIKNLDGSGELSIKEEKYLNVAKLCVQLAAENVALKAVFSQGEIPSEAVDAFMETAVMDHDWNETSEWSWVENETEVIHAVLNALKPETPATDRIVAGIKADGVEEFVEKCREKSMQAISSDIRNNWWLAGEHAEDFAKQLRDGGSHD